MSPVNRRIAELCDRIAAALFIVVVLAISAGLFGE